MTRQSNFLARSLVMLCAAFVAAMMMLIATAASADDDFPVIQHSGDISFCSGGIGDDEIQIMKALAPKYPLMLSFIARSNNHDAYTAPDQLTITKTDGAPVLDIKPDGPFVLVDLPAGKYQITATAVQQARTQTVQIVSGAHRKLVFQLPATVGQE